MIISEGCVMLQFLRSTSNIYQESAKDWLSSKNRSWFCSSKKFCMYSARYSGSGSYELLKSHPVFAAKSADSEHEDHMPVNQQRNGNYHDGNF